MNTTDNRRDNSTGDDNDIQIDAAAFVTSSFCSSGGCVGIAKFDDGSVSVKDTKDVASQILTFTSTEWSAFVKGVKNGEFDA
jgi:hypothetical protein